VAAAKAKYNISQRYACWAIGQNRSTQRFIAASLALAKGNYWLHTNQVGQNELRRDTLWSFYRFRKRRSEVLHLNDVKVWGLVSKVSLVINP